MKPTLSKLAVACTLAGSLVLSGCGKQTAEEHIVAAEQYIAANNNAAAVLELKSAIQVDPKSAEARFRLGRLYLNANQFESAEKELNRAMELGHPTAEILPLLSKAYRQTGATNALAEIDYSEGSLTSTESAQMGYYKLTALAELEKNGEARTLIDDLEQLDTQSVYRGLAIAYRPIIEKNFEKALDEALVLRKQAPLNEDVLRLVSKLQLIQQKPADAVETMEALTKVRPEDVEVLFTYTALLMDLRRFDDADPNVDKLLKLNSENGLLNQFKGVILASRDNYTEASPYLSKALANGRDNIIVRLLAGFASYRVGDYDGAVSHLSVIAAQLPGNHPGLRILADSQIILGQPQAASQTLANFEDTSENDASLFSRTGFRLLQQGNVEAARSVVDQGSQIDATADELLRLGVLQLSLNDIDGLVKLEEAVKVEPDSALTQKTLATAYLLSGKFDKAGALAEEWKTQQPDAYEPYLLAGEVALRAENIEEARVQFNAALQKAPNNADPKLALANLTILDGDVESAKSEIEAILADHPEHPQTLAVYFSILTREGDTSDAIARAKKALETAEDKMPLQLLLARMQFEEQDAKSALATLNEVDTQRDLPVVYWQLKGQSLLRSNDVQGATDHYRAWRSVAPFNRDATLGLLLTLDMQRQFEEALNVGIEYTQKRADPQIDVLKAYFHALLGNKQESNRLLDRLPEDGKQLPFVRGIYARLALLDNRFADAVSDAKVAYDSQPNIRNLVVYLRAVEGSGDAETGFEAVKEYLERNPDDQRGNLLLAERLIPRDKAAAIQAYESSIDAIPENFLALNNLAYLYYEDGRFDDALPLAEKAVSLRSSSPEAVDTLAQIHIAKGDLDVARDMYDKVLVNDTHNDEVMTNYIELLMKMGEQELAQRKVKLREWGSDAAKKKAKEIVSGS